MKSWGWYPWTYSKMAICHGYFWILIVFPPHIRAKFLVLRDFPHWQFSSSVGNEFTIVVNTINVVVEKAKIKIHIDVVNQFWKGYRISKKQSSFLDFFSREALGQKFRSAKLVSWHLRFEKLEILIKSRPSLDNYHFSVLSHLNSFLKGASNDFFPMHFNFTLSSQ